jgi:hypothetical protein
VFDAADRPRLLTLDPDEAEQGERVQFRLEASTAFAEAPLVDLGEGVVVEEVSVDGAVATVLAVIGGDAPVGERDVVADDSRRILGGVALRVRNATFATDPGCAAGGSVPSPAGLLLAALAVQRSSRRRPTASETPTSAKR